MRLRAWLVVRQGFHQWTGEKKVFPQLGQIAAADIRMSAGKYEFRPGGSNAVEGKVIAAFVLGGDVEYFFRHAGTQAYVDIAGIGAVWIRPFASVPTAATVSMIPRKRFLPAGAPR